MLFAEGSEFVDMGEYLLDGGVVWEVECLVDDYYRDELLFHVC